MLFVNLTTQVYTEYGVHLYLSIPASAFAFFPKPSSFLRPISASAPFPFFPFLDESHSMLRGKDLVEIEKSNKRLMKGLVASSDCSPLIASSDFEPPIYRSLRLLIFVVIKFFFSCLIRFDRVGVL